MGFAMSNSDHLHGQTHHSVAVVFNAIFDLLTDKNSSRGSDFFMGCFAESEVLGSFKVSQDVCARHAELAGECLFLQSLAFLTDEQKSELATLRMRLSTDWMNIISDAGRDHFLLNNQSCQSLFEKFDALFLSQLEWMKDVGFERCSKQQRMLILPESPFFGFLEIG
ncbi:hypothetical protein EBR21_01965 [bacterium]|nr:hypothetical protein [bacterium]